jgi:hypothetical protein
MNPRGNLDCKDATGRTAHTVSTMKVGSAETSEPPSFRRQSSWRPSATAISATAIGRLPRSFTVGAGHSLCVRRIIGSAFRAKNREIVDLAVLGVHQDDTAFPASKINRVIARIQNWRGTDKAIVPWSGNGFEADLKA